MNILAIDTATEACSVALLHAGVLFERHELAPRQHAQLALPFVDSVLAEAGIGKRQLDAIAVGRGPGGFTGVRLAISLAQGIALGLDIPVLPVSSLAALALDIVDLAPEAALLACIDARMGEVYAGVYRRSSEGLVQLQGDECVGPADRILLPQASSWAVSGSGWASYGEVLRQRIGTPVFADGLRFPRAAMIARLAAPRFARGEGVAPEHALPVYLRDKVALTTAERAVITNVGAA
jgi:tRNA threonylcarbamoyladenosine biosynthesis protein TsaB